MASWHGDTFLLRTEHGRNVEVKLAEGSLPDIHASIDAVGHPETDLYDVTLTRSSWRPASTPSAIVEPVVRNATIRELFTGPRNRPQLNVNDHGSILRITGTVKNILVDERGNRRLLLSDGEHSIAVDCGPAQGVFDLVAEGYRVRVTAVCIKESEAWRPSVLIPKVKGLFLVLRDEKDIKILARPPWWTPARLIISIAVLLAVLIAILVWNMILRRLVERRSREVIRAQERKLESELHLRERTRLAAEIHDSLSQNLTVVAYQVSAAKTVLAGKDREIDSALDTVSKTLKSFRTDLWRCLWDLRNDVLDEPDFAEAIRKTVVPVSGDTVLNIRFSGSRNKISDSTAHAILCALRELVANATLHGHATHIRIAGENCHDGIHLSVRDNGTGFNTQTRPGMNEGHFGLDGIAERLNRLGGAFKIESIPGKGTYARLFFRPMTADVTDNERKGRK